MALKADLLMARCQEARYSENPLIQYHYNHNLYLTQVERSYLDYSARYTRIYSNYTAQST